MGTSNGTTHRLDAARISAVRQSPNSSRGGLYVSRSARAGTANGAVPGPRDGEQRVGRLRELARQGRLATVAATADGADRAALTGAAYEVVWPIVFTRLTRRFEQSRGHTGCASGVDRLADACLDRFHDDVEAVVDDLLAHARGPVQHLEAWISARLTAATVDGHRRRRGRRGALQRPRLPGWVADALHHDRWLTTLATEILVWVGVSATAGTSVWPLEAWAHQRGLRTGDWSGSDPGVVTREVDTVLAVMRGRPGWYESYVERPLGAKQAPVAAVPVGDVTGGTATPLTLGDPDGRVDTELLRLAAEAVQAIDIRVTRGEDAEAIAVEVIRAVFGRTFTGTLDRSPYDVPDPLGGLTGALTDLATINRIITAVRTIIDEGRSQPVARPPRSRGPGAGSGTPA